LSDTSAPATPTGEPSDSSHSRHAQPALQRSDRRFLAALTGFGVSILTVSMFATLAMPSKSSVALDLFRQETIAYRAERSRAAKEFDDEIKRVLAELHGQLDALVQRKDAAAGH